MARSSAPRFPFGSTRFFAGASLPSPASAHPPGDMEVEGLLRAWAAGPQKSVSATAPLLEKKEKSSCLFFFWWWGRVSFAHTEGITFLFLYSFLLLSKILTSSPKVSFMFKPACHLHALHLMSVAL